LLNLLISFLILSEVKVWEKPFCGNTRLDANTPPFITVIDIADPVSSFITTGGMVSDVMDTAPEFTARAGVPDWMGMTTFRYGGNTVVTGAGPIVTGAGLTVTGFGLTVTAALLMVIELSVGCTQYIITGITRTT